VCTVEERWKALPEPLLEIDAQGIAQDPLHRPPYSTSLALFATQVTGKKPPAIQTLELGQPILLIDQRKRKNRRPAADLRCASMSLPLRPTHLPCAQQNAARRCPPGSTSAPAGCSFGSSHSQLVRVTMGSSYLRGARAPKALCVSDRLLLQRGCQCLPQDVEVCENAHGSHAGGGGSAVARACGRMLGRRAAPASLRCVPLAGARLLAQAPARPHARASGALGLQANLFGRLVRVVRSYANAIGAVLRPRCWTCYQAA